MELFKCAQNGKKEKEKVLAHCNNIQCHNLKEQAIPLGFFFFFFNTERYVVWLSNLMVNWLWLLIRLGAGLAKGITYQQANSFQHRAGDRHSEIQLNL